MKFIADFHIHSKYSRATSKDMDVEHLVEWAKIKGINLIGTGDFTHHLWLEDQRLMRVSRPGPCLPSGEADRDRHCWSLT